MHRGIVLLLLLGACGPKPPAFIDEVIAIDCDYLTACEDAAILTFNGWDDRDRCLADARERWEDRTSGVCEYDRKAAKACLDELESYVSTCPVDADGAPALPEACLLTHLNCTNGDDEVGGADDTAGDTAAR